MLLNLGYFLTINIFMDVFIVRYPQRNGSLDLVPKEWMWMRRIRNELTDFFFFFKSILFFFFFFFCFLLGLCCCYLFYLWKMVASFRGAEPNQWKHTHVFDCIYIHVILLTVFENKYAKIKYIIANWG